MLTSSHRQSCTGSDLVCQCLAGSAGFTAGCHPPPLRCRHRFLSSDRPRLPSTSFLRVFPSSFRQRRRRSFLASLSLGLSPLPSLGWTDSRRTDGGKSGQMDAKYANRERGRERHTESRFLKVKCSWSLWSFCLWSPAGCTSLNLIVETSSFPRR